MTNATTEIVQHWLDAWNAHDLDRAATCLAEGVTLDQPTETGETLRGRDAVRDYIAELYDAFPDARLDVKTVLADGDVAAVEYTFRGTQDGEYRGLRATETAVETPIVDVMAVGDGQIQAIRRYDRRPVQQPASGR